MPPSAPVSRRIRKRQARRTSNSGAPYHLNHRCSLGRSDVRSNRRLSWSTTRSEIVSGKTSNLPGPEPQRESRTSPGQLEEARAQIEAVSRQGKRYKQTDAAKHGDDRENVRLGVG